jgi:hypothetical protein
MCVRTRFVLLFALIGVQFPQSGFSADLRKWVAAPCSLAYVTPETDDIAIAFHCVPDSKELAVSFGFEPHFVKAGDPITFDLFSEAGSVTLEGKGERLLLDDIFLVEARTTRKTELLKIITEGQTLSILVEDGHIEFPLAGVTEVVTQVSGLFTECTKRRRPPGEVPPPE